MFRTHVAKKVQGFMNLGVSAGLMSGDQLPDYAELNKVLFGPQMFHVTDQHHLVSPVAFAVPEVRLLIEGSYVALGWPLPAVTGETMEEKILALKADDTCQSYINKAIAGADGSFYFVHGEPGTALLLPTGLLCITCNFATEKDSQGGATGLRWGVLPPKDSQLEKIRTTLKSTQDSYGKVSDDFVTWINCVADFTEDKVIDNKAA